MRILLIRNKIICFSPKILFNNLLEWSLLETNEKKKLQKAVFEHKTFNILLALLIYPLVTWHLHHSKDYTYVKLLIISFDYCILVRVYIL
jgi:hypothetical protein